MARKAAWSDPEGLQWAAADSIEPWFATDEPVGDSDDEGGGSAHSERRRRALQRKALAAALGARARDLLREASVPVHSLQVSTGSPGASPLRVRA